MTDDQSGPLRLGLDLGTTSIGWWLYRIEETESGRNEIREVVDGGVRIFSDGRDPKKGSSLAVDRRLARGARRRRDRYLRRRRAVLRELIGTGLLPRDPEERRTIFFLDPYELRARALDENIGLHALGRALFHLNQRRGFKSNRKTDGRDNEAGKIKLGTKRLNEEMAKINARTYGEFLHERRRSGHVEHQTPPVRTRMTALQGVNERDQQGYEFYPDRSHLESEFRKIWDAQQRYAPEILSGQLQEKLFKIIFHQRPLKAPKVGLCQFTGEKRLPKAHPLESRRVLMQDINHLRIQTPGLPDKPLSESQRKVVLKEFDYRKHTESLKGMKLSFKQLHKKLNLAGQQSFNFDTSGRDGIACDQTLASLSHPTRFGEQWRGLARKKQIEVVELLQNETDEQTVIDKLVKEFEIDCDKAQKIANAPLSEGYSRLGLKATTKILEKLEERVMTYSEAVQECGWHPSDFRTGEPLESLPYYGEILDRQVIPGTDNPKDDEVTRFGRISNPTVHIGLNQLRRIVNRIIKAYGKPDEIVVEVARELKLSDRQKNEWKQKINENTQAAERRVEKLLELGQPNTGANRALLRLWEDLGGDPLARKCPYSGRTISPRMLFDGSCDIDHILPYSKTLDDSMANRTVCVREANRSKRNRTPWETWGDTPQWDIIESNLKNLPKNKQWRFREDAMDRFEDEESFLDRALVDTQYLSRIANSYLNALYDGADNKRHVWVVPGKLTEMLRRNWGLNSLLSDYESTGNRAKNRTDHRHHAIDAAVVAATDHALIKRISDAARKQEEEGAERVARSTPEPWKGFREDIDSQIDKIIVSHKIDRGSIGATSKSGKSGHTTATLHNATAYGLTGETKNDVPLVVHRVPLDDKLAQKPHKIRDPRLREEISKVVEGKTGKDASAALAEFSRNSTAYRGIRRVRLIEPVKVIEVRDRDGNAYKSYKPDGNHCYEIWECPDGKWINQVVTIFDAHQSKTPSKPHPAAKRVMKLQHHDAVRMLDENGGYQIFIVAKFTEGQLALAPHNEANVDARDRDRENPFRYVRINPNPLKKRHGHLVRVDELGRVWEH